MDRLLSFSLRHLFGGARRGQPFVTGFAGLLTAVAVARRFASKERTLIYRRTLREGETIRIRLRRGDDVAADFEVTGVPAPGE